MQLEPIHLVVDEVTSYGLKQYRVRAVRCDLILATVVRWTEMAARQEMRRWITRNVPLHETYEVAN